MEKPEYDNGLVTDAVGRIKPEEGIWGELGLKDWAEIGDEGILQIDGDTWKLVGQTREELGTPSWGDDEERFSRVVNESNSVTYIP